MDELPGRTGERVEVAQLLGAPDRQLDSRGQLLGGSRLDDVVVGAGGQVIRDGLRAGVAGQEDHRRGRGAEVLPQLRQRGAAVELGHLDVHHDDVRAHLERHADPLLAIADGRAMEAAVLQDPAHDSACHLIVVDDEHGTAEC